MDVGLPVKWVESNVKTIYTHTQSSSPLKSRTGLLNHKDKKAQHHPIQPHETYKSLLDVRVQIETTFLFKERI